MGLASASIVLFLFFFIRRRRRTRRLEYDHAIASSLAEAGFNRTPVDGDDDGGKIMTQRRGSGSVLGTTLSSLPSAPGGRTPSLQYRDDHNASTTDFDPYVAYGNAHPSPSAIGGVFSSRKDGYVPARTSSPPTGINHSHSPSFGSHYTIAHIPRESAGSSEPLLAAASGVGTSSTPSAPVPGDGPPIPPRNPMRDSPKVGATNIDASANASGKGLRDSASSVYSDEVDDLLLDIEPRQNLEVSFSSVESKGSSLIYFFMFR